MRHNSMLCSLSCSAENGPIGPPREQSSSPSSRIARVSTASGMPAWPSPGASRSASRSNSPVVSAPAWIVTLTPPAPSSREAGAGAGGAWGAVLVTAAGVGAGLGADAGFGAGAAAALGAGAAAGLGVGPPRASARERGLRWPGRLDGSGALRVMRSSSASNGSSSLTPLGADDDRVPLHGKETLSRTSGLDTEARGGLAQVHGGALALGTAAARRSRFSAVRCSGVADACSGNDCGAA